MKEKDLSILVEKYLAAETSLEEEQYLKNQLKSEKNASLYPELVSMFEFFDTQESRISIPEFTDPSAPIPEATQPSEAKYRKLWPALTAARSEEHTSELQSRGHLVCRLLLEKKKDTYRQEKHERGKVRMMWQP